MTTNDGPGVPPERSPETTSVFRADFLSEADTPAQDQPVSGVESLPAGYRIEVGGDSEESAKSQGSIFKMMPVMAFLMLLFLMLQLRRDVVARLWRQRTIRWAVLPTPRSASARNAGLSKCTGRFLSIAR